MLKKLKSPPSLLTNWDNPSLNSRLGEVFRKSQNNRPPARVPQTNLGQQATHIGHGGLFLEFPGGHGFFPATKNCLENIGIRTISQKATGKYPGVLIAFQVDGKIFQKKKTLSSCQGFQWFFKCWQKFLGVQWNTWDEHVFFKEMFGRQAFLVGGWTNPLDHFPQFSGWT